MASWRAWLGLPERRSLTPSTMPWLSDSVPFNMGPTLASSTAVSQTRALQLASVYSANRLLAQSVSTLPLKAYRRGTEARIPMANLPALFDELVTYGELVPWLHRCTVSLGLRGNAYGYKVRRDGFGFPTLVEWLDPTTIVPDERVGKTGWLVNGVEVAREDIVHIPLFPLAGQRVSPSPIASFAATLGVGLQAQSYASDWFANGGFPPGTFKNQQVVIDPEDAAVIKSRLVQSIRDRAPLVYGKDWDYNAITVPPEEAQFIETMKMTTNQIAAIYGIPPEMIGGESGSSMTYANVEQQQINFVMFTLRPWLVILEHAFSALLPDRQYVRFNADALIRADLKTRWEVNKIRVDMGESNVDEIRTQEDKPPLPNGQGQKYGQTAPPPAIEPPGDVTPIRRVQ